MKLEDLAGPTCARCGADMPEGRRADAIFCSGRCARLSYREAESRALAEARSGRTCPTCGGEVHATISTKRYCSPACAQTASNAIARYPGTCEHCGRDFLAKNRGQRFCSFRCRDSARRKHHPRACIRCGAEYQPRRAAAKYCSLLCAARHREETRRKRAAVTPSVTPKRG